MTRGMYDPDPLRAKGTDDYIFGLYAPDRPRSGAAALIVACAVAVIVGAFLVLAFTVWG